MKTITNKQKDKLLIKHGYKYVDGYAMEYSAPESENILITVEEIKKVVCTKPTRYYFLTDDYEYSLDIDSAWESLCDDIYTQNDMKNDDELDLYLLNEIIELKICDLE